MSALTKQSGGSHYKNLAIQPVEYIHANGIGYMEGNVIKYVTRWKQKGGVADLEKAKHYIDLLIELEMGKEAVDAPKPAESGDGWIQWYGGDCPVPAGTMVRVRFRNGNEHEGPALNSWCTYQGLWRIGIEDDLAPCDEDIIAYRIISPTA